MSHNELGRERTRKSVSSDLVILVIVHLQIFKFFRVIFSGCPVFEEEKAKQ